MWREADAGLRPSDRQRHRSGHHTPYNRRESKYASEGFDLSRSVLCESANTCGKLLGPIAEGVRKDALATGTQQTDETPVKL